MEVLYKIRYHYWNSNVFVQTEYEEIKSFIVDVRQGSKCTSDWPHIYETSPISQIIYEIKLESL